jgi:integrase
MESFLASRIDVDERTVRNHRTALRKAGELFGDRDPASLTADEVAAWVADLAKRHKPGTVRQYLISLRLLLDFAGLDEKNPARDPRVKLPKRVREEPAPPLAEHMEAILAALPDRFRLLLVTIEQGALRLGEACGLRWGDVDASGLRLRLPRSATKRDSARWVYLPEWLMAAIEETYGLLAVTMCASIGMTISPEGTTNSASAISDSAARLAMASSLPCQPGASL